MIVWDWHCEWLWYVDKHNIITSMKVDMLRFANGEITSRPATWHVSADMTQIYPELKAFTLPR